MKEKKLGLSGYLMIHEDYDEIKDPPVPKKPKWCGKHKPMTRDVCPIHGLRWEELEGKLTYYAIASIFYCPVLSCDEFDCAVDYSNYSSVVPRKDDGRNEYFQFCVDVRLKILFHKLSGREGDGK